MTTSTRIKMTVTTALAVAALAPVAAATASVNDPIVDSQATATQTAATPTNASAQQLSSTIELRRDGDAATAFVADASPSSGSSVADDGFDWGLAAIIGGAGLLLATGAFTMGAFRDHSGRPRKHLPSRPQSV